MRKIDYILRSCSHCGLKMRADDYIDAIHPTTRQNDTWVANCLTIAGGCDTTVYGDSESDVVRIWNMRSTDALLADAARALALHMKNVSGTDVPNLESQVHARIMLELGQ